MYVSGLISSSVVARSIRRRALRRALFRERARVRRPSRSTFAQPSSRRHARQDRRAHRLLHGRASEKQQTPFTSVNRGRSVAAAKSNTAELWQHLSAIRRCQG
jgi:hypothetical protein